MTSRFNNSAVAPPFRRFASRCVPAATGRGGRRRAAASRRPGSDTRVASSLMLLPPLSLWDLASCRIGRLVPGLVFFALSYEFRPRDLRDWRVKKKKKKEWGGGG